MVGQRASNRHAERAARPLQRFGPTRGSFVKIGDLCMRDVHVAEPRESARDAARRMSERSVGTLVVVDALRRPLGIVTDRDLAMRCVAGGLDPARTEVAKIMSGPAAWVHEAASLDEALDEMARLRVRRLPVVDERDRLVGILALDDVLVRSLPDGSAQARALRASLGEAGRSEEER
jgi:CBS domain-containing protein